MIDLGIHLVDIALWCLGFPTVLAATGRLFSQGRPLEHANDKVEDYSMGQIELATGATVRFACSWKLSAGCDAVISGSFYGNKGGANFRNIDGSFYDFVAEKFQGTKRLSLSQGLEPWGGRGAVSWAQRLASGGGFDPDVQSVNIVAEILDAIYTSAVHRDGTGVTNRNRRPAI